MRPRLLDLFCCEGGAASGYIRAGWDVTGVDTDPNRLKYGPGETVLADALEYVAAHGHEYDAIHASPPCQGYTRGNAGRETSWPNTAGPGVTSTRRSTSVRVATLRRTTQSRRGHRLVARRAASWSRTAGAAACSGSPRSTALLGIEHEMTWGGLFECLPPAYTEHIGAQLLTSLERAA